MWTVFISENVGGSQLVHLNHPVCSIMKMMRCNRCSKNIYLWISDFLVNCCCSFFFKLRLKWYFKWLIWTTFFFLSVTFVAGMKNEFVHRKFPCPSCHRGYEHKSSLYKHRKFECGMERQFWCPYCPYRAKQRIHLQSHIMKRHSQRLKNKIKNLLEN